MSVIKSLWASVQGDPVFMRKVNGWLTILWVVMIPVSILTGWIGSVTYVAALSLWALVSGHWSAWQAARVEVEQARQEEEKSNRKTSRGRSLNARSLRPSCVPALAHRSQQTTRETEA
jgi:hypothetical protein